MRGLFITALFGCICFGKLVHAQQASNRRPAIDFMGFKVYLDNQGVGAETPYGQNAFAGMQGRIDQNGRISGKLDAGASAGGNVRAAAGLGGQVGSTGPSGTITAASSNGVASSGSVIAGQVENGRPSGVIQNVRTGPGQNPTPTQGWTPDGLLTNFFNNFRN